jgi:hypothetical protein
VADGCRDVWKGKQGQPMRIEEWRLQQQGTVQGGRIARSEPLEGNGQAGGGKVCSGHVGVHGSLYIECGKQYS